MSRSVFVSYSHQDEEAAHNLKRALGRRGFDAWLARDEIGPGDNVVDRIQEGLRSASAVVLLIGKEPSTWARNEWSQALGMSWDADRALSLVPVLLPDAEPPPILRDHLQVRIQDDPKDWDRVADMLERSPDDTFAWRTSDSARTDVADRLTALEKVAATLPDD